MRILLQSFETGLYLDTSGDWTDISDLARSFPSTRQAAEFKLHRRLANAFVVVLPETARPLNVTGRHNETTLQAQELAKPVGRPVKAIQATMTKEGRLARSKSAMATHHSGSNPCLCNISV
jgi:hypothetical protein